MATFAIRAHGLGKQYRVGLSSDRGRYRTLREDVAALLTRPARSKGVAQTDPASFWALRDVSFEVEPGRIVGLIGKNGAGKSTLLKILSRVTEPTTGTADIYGRVGSLLEVGTGFHSELTGRENVFLSGAILGMRRHEISQRFDDIVDFAEVAQFIDTPVKRYSSGMYMRLAFAVAAFLQPDVLFLDEVLAVGDMAFQQKCLGQIGTVARQGRTVLIVSHNLAVIRQLCDSAILLDRGTVAAHESTDRVIPMYLAATGESSGRWQREAPIPRRSGIYFREVAVVDEAGCPTGTIGSTEGFGLRVELCATSQMRNIQIALRVTNQDGIPVFTTASSDVPRALQTLAEGEHKLTVRIPANFLPPGRYSIIAAVMTPGVERYDMVDGELSFVVQDTGGHATMLRDARLGVVTPELPWLTDVESLVVRSA